jgi:hypothetical protein
MFFPNGKSSNSSKIQTIWPTQSKLNWLWFFYISWSCLFLIFYYQQLLLRVKKLIRPTIWEITNGVKADKYILFPIVLDKNMFEFNFSITYMIDVIEQTHKIISNFYIGFFSENRFSLWPIFSAESCSIAVDRKSSFDNHRQFVRKFDESR